MAFFKMELVLVQELRKPVIASNPSRIFDSSISPLERLRFVGADEFEDITTLWLKELLGREYSNIAQLGGSKDAGRDVVAYLLSDASQLDLFQCK